VTEDVLSVVAESVVFVVLQEPGLTELDDSSPYELFQNVGTSMHDL
jgi:hypothetical protein